MKKLILLLATGFIVLSIGAQQNSCVIFLPQAEPLRPLLTIGIIHKHEPHGTNSIGAKKTNGNANWFSFQDARKHSPTTDNCFLIAQDSALYVPNATSSPFFFGCTGLGTSFDPTSYAFVLGNGGGFVNPNPLYPPPSFIITAADPYSIDSVTFAGYYRQVHHYTTPDTLIVDFFVASNSISNTFLLTHDTPTFCAPIMPTDSQTNFACGVYKPFYGGFTSDSILSGVVTWKHPLGLLPTDTGFHQFTIPINLSAPAGAKIVGFQHFRSYQQYTPSQQTPIDSANLWAPYCYEINGATNCPTQKPYDANCGLYTDNHVYYGDNAAWATDTSHGHLVPSCTYLYGPPSASAPVYFQDPWFAFLVSCASCVANVPTERGIISSLKVYPIPATDNLTIDLALTEKGNVNISLTNTLGQLIRSQNADMAQKDFKVRFDVTDMPSGVYFYIIYANGECNLGRFVVAH